jgi:hypothetical protein
MFCLFFHPGDLSFWELTAIIIVALLLTVVPLCLIGLIIYKVFKNRGDDAEEQTVTLKLN